MVRSRLPVPSLLGLFGALLVLFQDLPGNLSDVPLTNPEVQKALAFAMLKYNQDRSDSANYFKHLRLLKAKSEGLRWKDHYLKVELVKTTCQKKAGNLTYKKIQECDQGKNKKGICCFQVTTISVNIMHSQITSCDWPGLP